MPAMPIADCPLAIVALPDVPSAPPLARVERETLARFPVEKRRRDWLLGRLAAKAAVRAELGPAAPGAERLAIVADEHGAPVAHVEDEAGALAPLAVALSLSHGHERAVAWASAARLVGVDLELIRPRPDGTLRFYLSAEEQLLARCFDAPAERDRAAVVLWALKEAAWKALRPARGAALIHVALALDAPAAAGRGTASARYSGPAAERARALGVTPEARAEWAIEDGIAFAWAWVVR